MINEMVDASRNFSFKDGKFKKGEKYKEDVDDDEYLLILNKDGEVLYGQYPENLNPHVKINRGRLVTVKGKQKIYYMYDRTSRRLSKEYGDKIYTRIVVNKQNIRSEYLKIKYEGYLMAAIMLFLVLLYSLYMAKRLQHHWNRCVVLQRMWEQMIICLRELIMMEGLKKSVCYLRQITAC